MSLLQTPWPLELWQDCKPSAFALAADKAEMNEDLLDRRNAGLGAPAPADDPERLAALWATGLLDTPPSEAFDRVIHAVAQLFKAPIALVSLVDEKRQWVLARHGIEMGETPRDQSFCGHVVASGRALRVEDARLDARFAAHPLVAGEPFLRAYLGVPLAGAGGHTLGTVCVIDRRVREFSAADLKILQRYALALQQLIRG
jgi:GAF domain-containing protein